MVRTVTGADVPIVHEALPADDPTRRRPDITLAREVLGWEPRISLHDALERTCAWYRDELARSEAP